MIVFNNWKITHIGDLLAYQYDNLSCTLLVKGVPEGYTWKMMVKSQGNLNILALSPMEGGVGVVLKRDHLALSGYYTMQLVGTLQADGVTERHTNPIQVFVPPSLSGDAKWPTIPSEFTQAEDRIRELNSHPPVPGENGYWLIWNQDNDTYEESELPVNAYTLPIATSEQLGGVNPVAKTDTMTQSVGVDEAGALWTEPGSGGVSSWNDLTNRPFGSNVMKEAAIFENQALIDAGSGHYMYIAQFDSIPEDWPTIAVGDEAKVVIDGVVYNSTWSTYQQEGIFGCGNLAVLGIGEDTGDPYVLLVGTYDSSGVIQLVFIGTEGETHTASAYVVHEDIQKLDEKYLRGTLLPDNATRGNFVVRGLSSWILCDNPTKLRLIESKNAEIGTSEVRFTIDKIYTKLFLVASNFHVSGTIDKDIEVSALQDIYRVLGSMKKAATAKNGEDVISFMVIERMPYIGYVSTAPAAPIEDPSSPSQATEMNLVTVRSTAPSFVVEGERDRSYLCLRITGDKFDKGSSNIVPDVTLYGILDSDSLR